MNFRVFNLSIDSRKQEWIEIWKTWPGTEVYAHPEFIKLGGGSLKKLKF